MENKGMLTYEEWIEFCRRGNGNLSDFLAARQGMIEPLVVDRMIINKINELVKNGLFIDLRNIEWPEGANSIHAHFTSCTAPEIEEESIPNWLIAAIPRPVTEWRPKENQKVWRWHPHSSTAILSVWEKGDKIYKGELIAAANSLDEMDWTKKQFRERGEVWEVCNVEKI